MFKFKVWLCKAIDDVHSAADESVKLRFYKQTKKKTYPNKTITQIIICLIGIILRDVLLREYPHFAITINFKIQPNYNFFTSYTISHVSCFPGQICVIFTRTKFQFRHSSYLSIYSARFSLSIYKWSNLKSIYELTGKENISHCGTHKHSFFFSCLRGPVDQL